MGYQVNSENIYMSGHEHLLSQRRCSKHIINLILKLDTCFSMHYVTFNSHMVSFMMQFFC